jgi:DNA primase
MTAFLDRVAATAGASILEHADVLSYLIGERKLSRADIERFGVGYSEHLLARKEDTKEFREFEKSSNGFRSLQRKLLFPIRSCNGSTLGFVARHMGALPPAEPGKMKPARYRQFVTEESKVVGGFFGLTEALPHILKTGYVYVVEGAIDCITLAKVFPNTVSTLTSSVNEAQMWVLLMLVEKVILVFDTDEPGVHGAEYVLSRYGGERIKVRDISYHDPNACLQTLGEEGLKIYMKKKLAFLSCKKGHRG